MSRSPLFTITHWQAQSPHLRLHYHCDRFGAFTETITFPVGWQDTAPLSPLFDLLHAVCGLSYYKAGAATNIAVPCFKENAAAQKAVTRLYTDGLAEFFVRNNLAYPPETNFTFAEKERAPIAQPSLAEKAVVAFGGGKDSYVADAIADRAGIETSLASVVLSPKVAEVLRGFSHKPLHLIERTLDPALTTLADPSAYNGHIPITAINALCLTILATLNQHRYVIFANERSADEPTLIEKNFTANHQYSKSSDYEALLRAAINEAHPEYPHFFSILRPYSEIWIARALTKIPTALEKFSSCNRNFHIDGRQTVRWCGACAKCAFTYLMLAPHLTPAQRADIFPADFLQSEKLLPVYEQLLGLASVKPWDCIGTIDECRAALWQVARQDADKKSIIVSKLLPEILTENDPSYLEESWAQALRMQPTQAVPLRFQEAARAFD